MTSDNRAAAPQTLWVMLACAWILVVAVVVWANGLKGPFIFDDLIAIRDNPTLRHFPAWENFVPPHENSLSRRPVVNLTLALNYAIGGLDVRGFHAGNLLIHLLTALLLLGIVRRTLNELTMDPGRRTMVHAPSSIIAVSFAVALIWAVHPLLTEPMDYLTQRTELLMGLFFLLTLYCAVRGASSGHPRRWHAAAIAACALGMGSKEVMAAAPVIVLLYDRCFLSGSFREALRRRLSLYLGLAATWAILGALMIAYPWGGGTGAGLGLVGIGPWEYVRTQPGVILNYLRLSFWPSSLCLDYGWPIATSAGQIFPAAAVIAAMLGATLWALSRRPAFGFLGAWFFLILAPTSTFVPIADAAAERRMYLPLAAIVTSCVLAAYWLGDQLVRHVAEDVGTRKLLGRVLAALALLLVTAALGYRTFERNALYRDAISIWQDTVTQRPRNARAWGNLGMCYVDAGLPGEAVPCFSQAIELKRDNSTAYSNRGSAFIHNDRGIAFARMNRLDEAVQDYDTAIALNPDYAEAYVNRGAAYADSNRFNEALQDYSRAVALQPDNARAYSNRAVVGLRTGRFNEALSDCDKAIALQPDYANAYLNRAYGRYLVKEFDKALADLNTCVQLGGKPDPEFIGKVLQAAGQAK
jgi:tetratricopeptide (TPR) repeat protein